MTLSRAYGVMVGGPLVLLLAAIACVGFTVWSLVRGEQPPWLALGGVVALGLYVVVFKPWSRRWGATPQECRTSLPGDEQVQQPAIEMTRAVTIAAPPQRVWPWIAQVGQDRGGFYSYTRLENLAGCHMRNAVRVHPEWQHREVGDNVPLHPMAGIELSRFEPHRSYALQGWYFALAPQPHGGTRLLARSRIPRGATSLLYALFIELPHFIMERKMLLTIKQRVENEDLVKRKL